MGLRKPIRHKANKSRAQNCWKLGGRVADCNREVGTTCSGGPAAPRQLDPTAIEAPSERMRPLRVVSLLPSATEVVQLVADGCDGAVILVGRSHECDFPPEVEAAGVLTASKIKWTDSADVDRQVREALSEKAVSSKALYTVDRQLLTELRPDVIVTQSLCEVCCVDYCQVEDIAAGLDPRPLVVDLNPRSLQDVLADVRRLGALMGQPAAGEAAGDALQVCLWLCRAVHSFIIVWVP